MTQTRSFGYLIAVFLLIAGGFPAAQAGGGGRSIRFSGLEKCFLAKINSQRRSRGERALRWDRQIGYVARAHSRQIAQERTLRHDYNYTKEITHWKRLGQNTGVGKRCDSLFRAFMSSSTHRKNILGKWRYVGVGVTRAGGRIYVQQVFESKRNPGNIY